MARTLRELLAAGTVAARKRPGGGWYYRVPAAAPAASSNGAGPPARGELGAAILAALAATPEQRPGELREALGLTGTRGLHRLRWALGVLRKSGLVVNRGKTTAARYRLTPKGAKAAHAAT